MVCLTRARPLGRAAAAVGAERDHAGSAPGQHRGTSRSGVPGSQSRVAGRGARVTALQIGANHGCLKGAAFEYIYIYIYIWYPPPPRMDLPSDALKMAAKTGGA